MTVPHAVFLDFDGTLAEGGVVPPVHVQALAKLRERGHRVFVCTGRPDIMVPRDVDAAVDGVIGGAGAYARVGSDVIRDVRFPEDLARATVRELEKAGVPFVLEQPEAAYGNAQSHRFLESWVESFNVGGGDVEPGALGGGGADILDAFRESDNLESESFAKAVVWGSPVPVTEYTDAVGPEVRPMPNSIDRDGNNSGEIQQTAVDKIDGVRAVAEYLGIPMENTVACGDGLNDVDMLRGVGRSVVIEGTTAARDVENPTLAVPGPKDGGLDIAFEKLGLYA